MRLIKFTFLFIFAFIWLAALNGDVFRLASKLSIVHDGYQFGDLYRLSNLPQFKEPQKKCPPYSSSASPDRKVTNLFLIGDSFTEPQRISKADFTADAYRYIHWSETLELKLDTSAHNILLIECVERHVREKFAAPLNNIKEASATVVNQSDTQPLMTRLDAAFSSKAKEERFEMLMLQNDVILTIKEWKAAFNYFFFDRVRKEVTLVNGGKDIVYFMDTDTIQNNRDPKTGIVIPKTTSSFTPLSNSEVRSIVDNIMKSKKLAEKMGFDQVIVSIIPNKVSVIDPDYGPYNHLIERVFADSSLKMPVIDVLPEFKKMGRSAYLVGDSHWTCEGQNIWLRKANNAILNIR